jgi:acetoacetyl-CoA synthetase
VDRGEVLWEPTGEPTRLGEFMAATGHVTWSGLLDWSLTDLDGFWRAVATELGVRWRTPPDGGIALAADAMPGAAWFPGARLNYAEHALARATEDPHGVAVIARSQSRAELRLTWAQLAEQVARAAAGLRQLGVGPGDRVAAYAPNCAETLVAFLAAASIGAVW